MRPDRGHGQRVVLTLQFPEFRARLGVVPMERAGLVANDHHPVDLHRRVALTVAQAGLGRRQAVSRPAARHVPPGPSTTRRAFSGLRFILGLRLGLQGQGSSPSSKKPRAEARGHRARKPPCYPCRTTACDFPAQTRSAWNRGRQGTRRPRAPARGFLWCSRASRRENTHHQNCRRGLLVSSRPGGPG